MENLFLYHFFMIIINVIERKAENSQKDPRLGGTYIFHWMCQDFTVPAYIYKTRLVIQLRLSMSEISYDECRHSNMVHSNVRCQNFAIVILTNRPCDYIIVEYFALDSISFIHNNYHH